MKSYIQSGLRPKKTHPRPEPFVPELTAEGLGSKARGKSKPVSPFSKGGRGIFLNFEFGNCPSTGLRVVSLSNHLLFGAWNFLYSKTPLFLDMLFDFLNVFLGHNTELPVYLSLPFDLD